MADFNDCVDGKLAFRMRKVNPEQFHTLVKMHLSFELDLNTEDNDAIIEKARLKKWSLPSFAKKSKSLVNLEKGAEGATLSEDSINHVTQLIDYLSEEQNIMQEGIFRRTGKLTRQQELKTAVSQGLSLNLNDGQFSVHDCASVLKGFLAELSEPLLTDLHYPAHCQIAELCSLDAKTNDARLLRSLQLLLLLLPLSNRILLKAVLTLLHKTASYEHSNKMNSDTLATLFTPHLLCPRKLSPEALHINSQNLSCLVAFMIRKGTELFEIPPKLATDIRAYWMEQERKLLSPKKTDLNESIPDTTATAHTVFSFVDRKLTAKANSTQDTQAALAQLYAHIQTLPESAKKRRLVKQFNKENGQGTPRHVKNCKTKSLGDSIKKHIFQKKILSQKKFIDINIGCNMTRSSSEENILSTNLADSSLPTRVFLSKSNDELSVENCDTVNTDLFYIKHNSIDSLKSKTLNCKVQKNSCNQSNTNIREDINERCIMKQSLKDVPRDTSSDPNNDRFSLHDCAFVLKRPMGLDETSLQEIDATSVLNEEFSRNIAQTKSTTSNYNLSDKSTDKLARQLSEPPDMYSTRNIVRYNGSATTTNNNNGGLIRQNSEPTLSFVAKSDDARQVTPLSKTRTLSAAKASETASNLEQHTKNAARVHLSPITKNKFKNLYTVHTSTPSNLLRQSLVINDYISTPITNNDDKSMSPITQSATKMTKAMQETMMTPRSRKPVMIVSTSNLCSLVTNNNNNNSCNQRNLISNNILCGSNVFGAMNCTSILEESQVCSNSTDNMPFPNTTKDICVQDTENMAKCYTTAQQSSVQTTTNTFREYLLSRSVQTASPVDLSFTSRTGDFEQSESDLNILNDEGTLSDSLLCCLDDNQPDTSDTSGIASSSTNSANNSTDKISEELASPRKRGTSLQRNDSKRSAKEIKDSRRHSKHRRSSNESSIVKIKDSFQETSF